MAYCYPSKGSATLLPYLQPDSNAEIDQNPGASSVPLLDVAGLLLDDPIAVPTDDFIRELQEAIATVGFFQLSGFDPDLLGHLLNSARAWFEDRPFGFVNGRHCDEQPRLAVNHACAGGSFAGRGYMSGLQEFGAPERCSIDWARPPVDGDKDEQTVMWSENADSDGFNAVDAEIGAVQCRSRRQLAESGFVRSYVLARNPQNFDRALESMINNDLVPLYKAVGRKLFLAVAVAVGKVGPTSSEFDDDVLRDLDAVAGEDNSSDPLKRPWWYTRLIYYPDQATVGYLRKHYAVGGGSGARGEAAIPHVNESSKTVLMKPHTDFGWITLLLQTKTQTPSLEIKDRSGAWVGVDPRPGCMIVNFGDMMASWSSGKLLAREHRVVAGDPSTSRVSIPFFYGPCLDAVIPDPEVFAVDERGAELGRVADLGGLAGGGLSTYGLHLAKRLGYKILMPRL